jgi:hypothetical protein
MHSCCIIVQNSFFLTISALSMGGSVRACVRGGGAAIGRWSRRNFHDTDEKKFRDHSRYLFTTSVGQNTLKMHARCAFVAWTSLVTSPFYLYGNTFDLAEELHIGIRLTVRASKLENSNSSSSFLIVNGRTAFECTFIDLMTRLIHVVESHARPGLPTRSLLALPQSLIADVSRPLKRPLQYLCCLYT